jgi:hypothetical protein
VLVVSSIGCKVTLIKLTSSLAPNSLFPLFSSPNQPIIMAPALAQTARPASVVADSPVDLKKNIASQARVPGPQAQTITSPSALLLEDANFKFAPIKEHMVSRAMSSRYFRDMHERAISDVVIGMFRGHTIDTRTFLTHTSVPTDQSRCRLGWSQLCLHPRYVHIIPCVSIVVDAQSDPLSAAKAQPDLKITIIESNVAPGGGACMSWAPLETRFNR